MAFSELIKNFRHIREYMRQFYVYGFRSRTDFDRKSLRSYDDERRRVESWLGEYMGFSRTRDGKNIFLSIDSRAACHNPLYKAWKAASFTDRDITLHFIIFDILHDGRQQYTLPRLTEKIYSDYLADFDLPLAFDESTLRKKLKEYINAGLIKAEKQGRSTVYSRCESRDINGLVDVLDYFSEISPAGVTGSFMLDRLEDHSSIFRFKHHYITQALDSEIMYMTLCAISRQKKVQAEIISRSGGLAQKLVLTPLKIFISTAGGRQYLMAARENGDINAFRLDYIDRITIAEKAENFVPLRRKLAEMQKHIWGANCRNDGRTERVEFSVVFTDEEKHIPRRLEREKRCGTVRLADSSTAVFTADVYDSREMIPWIRTFICRIGYINFENEELDKSFRKDLEDMYRLYGLEE